MVTESRLLQADRDGTRWPTGVLLGCGRPTALTKADGTVKVDMHTQE